MPTVDKTGDGSRVDPRTKTFQLVSNVPVFGGFAGTETELKQRNPSGNETILSGDLGTIDDVADNSYCVVRGADNTILDGFTVVGGNGNGTVSIETDMGGGQLNNTVSNVKARNSIFNDNFSIQAGVVANNWCTD